MNKKEIISKCANLSENDSADVHQKLEQLEELEKQSDKLSKDLSSLSSDELKRLEEEQDKFMEESSTERRELESTDEIEEHDYRYNEILTSYYPVGICMLERQMEELDTKIEQIINSSFSQE